MIGVQEMFCRRWEEGEGIMVKFGREPGLSAIWASLLCVRKADGGVRVAEGGGEDVGGPEVSTR